MHLSIPAPWAPWLIGLSVLGIVIALVLTIRAYLQSRSGAYYAVREQALRTAGRALLVTLVFLALTITLILIPKHQSTPQSTPTATVRLAPTPTQALTTPTPLPMATATPTSLPTATEPFIPTTTPTPRPPDTALTPLPSAVPPPADAHIELTGLAQEVDENGFCQEPATQFPSGVGRLYLCYTYDGLLPNVPWTVAWYCGGEYLGGGTSLWESGRAAGNGYVFLSPSQGYPVGECEAQIWLAERLQFRARFKIVGAEN